MAYGEVEKGSCIIKVNGIEHQQRMYMWEYEEDLAPIMLNVPSETDGPRKLRLIYDYVHKTHEFNIKFVDCNNLYRPIGTSMNVCAHLFSTKLTASLNQTFEIIFGGKFSNEPEIKVTCKRTGD